MVAICSFSGCGRPVKRTGLCQAHYELKRTGKPLRALHSHATSIRQVQAHPTDPTLALVELTRGRWSIIDAADAEAVGRYNWQAKKHFNVWYATRWSTSRDPWLMAIHTLIAQRMGLRRTGVIDHKNGNGLDNRRLNLRDATVTQNAQNCQRSISNTSGKKGIVWHARDRGWQAMIRVNGKRRYVGRFLTIKEADAALAVARAAAHGEFASARGNS